MTKLNYSDILDLSQFVGVTNRDVNNFFIKNGVQITSAIVNRGCKHSVSGCGISISLEQIISSAAEIGSTIHALLVGREMPVALLPDTTAVLTRMGKLSDDQRDYLVEYLKENAAPCNNPYYILRCRFIEYSQFQGESVSELIKAAKTSYSTLQNLTDLCCRVYVPFDLKECDNLPFLRTAGHHLVLIRACVNTQLAADYFACQDYSNTATIEGNPLTDQQKQWLSVYLMASEKAREYARFYLVGCRC